MSKVVAVFLLLFLPLSVGAQTDTIAGKVHSLQGVEVLSKSHNALAASVPLQQMSNQRMLELGIQTMADALTHIAGITIRDYGGAGGMKTVSVRGIGSRHTGILYDGIALSDCQTGEIDLSRYSLDNVSLLKMIIGDGDDIFQPARNASTAASLAIDNIRPPVSDRQGHLKARLTYGSWNTIVPSLYYGQSLSDRLSVSLMGEFTHSDNDYPFKLYNGNLITTEHRQNSKMNAGHIEGNILWLMTDRQSLSGKVYYYDNNRQLPGIVHLYTNENDETLKEQNAFMQLTYKDRMSEKFSLQGNVKYNWAKSDYHNGNSGSGIVDSRYYQQEYYASLAMMYSPLSWFSMDYSGDYFFNLLTSNQTSYERPSRHSILQSLSAKVSNERLTFVARALWSNYLNEIRMGDAGANGHRLSPSLSLSYRLLADEDLYIRAFWKSIYRMPTFNELYFYHIGSTSLKPEKANQWNLGITYGKQSKRWETQFTTDAYINKVDDKIVAIPFNMFVFGR
jgi:vitamin B12 transporter